jgi:hypothetical protein
MLQSCRRIEAYSWSLCGFVSVVSRVSSTASIPGKIGSNHALTSVLGSNPISSQAKLENAFEQPSTDVLN